MRMGSDFEVKRGRARTMRMSSQVYNVTLQTCSQALMQMLGNSATSQTKKTS